MAKSESTKVSPNGSSGLLLLEQSLRAIWWNLGRLPLGHVGIIFVIYIYIYIYVCVCVCMCVCVCVWKFYWEKVFLLYKSKLWITFGNKLLLISLFILKFIELCLWNITETKAATTTTITKQIERKKLKIPCYFSK